MQENWHRGVLDHTIVNESDNVRWGDGKHTISLSIYMKNSCELDVRSAITQDVSAWGDEHP